MKKKPKIRLRKEPYKLRSKTLRRMNNELIIFRRFDMVHDHALVMYFWPN